jgi:tetratricopeptide (TPR) repeat protein
MRINAMKTVIVLLLSAVSTVSYAETSLSDIQNQWGKCQYTIKEEKEKIACLEALIKKNQQDVTQSPNDLEKQVWLAINLSSLAGAKGGLGALSLVKRAKVILEGVIEKDPNILKGSAYTSLGSLYYQVPGWPVGFGSDKKAEANLLKALSINPKGIDPNFFYADFLAQDGRKKEARKYFELALKADPRPGREVSDKGRRLEIHQKLEELNR